MFTPRPYRNDNRGVGPDGPTPQLWGSMQTRGSLSAPEPVQADVLDLIGVHDDPQHPVAADLAHVEAARQRSGGGGGGVLSTPSAGKVAACAPGAGQNPGPDMT
jgi:hypothetical protein